MSKTLKNTSKICLIICAVICAVLILLQFAPNWTYQNTETNSTETISILGYMTLPGDNADVTNYFESNDKQFDINSLATTFAIVFALGIVTIVFVFLKSNKFWISVWPFATGIGSLIGYLTDPLWQLGSVYIISVVLSAVLTVVSLVALVIWFMSIANWFSETK